MIVERFSKTVIGSGIFRLFIATGFFATLIFFVLNAHSYTPMDMIIGVVVVTITLKGLANMMLSLVILLFNLENKEQELDYRYSKDKINSLLAELSVQEAKLNNEKPTG